MTIRTFATLASKEKILDKLQEVAEELERDMDEEGWTGHTVTLKWKLDTFQGAVSPPLLLYLLNGCLHSFQPCQNV